MKVTKRPTQIFLLQRQLLRKKSLNVSQVVGYTAQKRTILLDCYQLSSSYLNGDFSPANQEKVADNYVASRYGSWTAALAFWNANGWY